jgi:probable F420-dependent oxidoreductase
MRVGISTFVTDECILPGSLAAEVERRGFYSLIVTEHSHMPVAYEPPFPGAGDPAREYYRTLDPFVTLASAAATTETLVLVTGVILLPQRDVIYTAKEVATLDLVSNGRVVLGVGVGWNQLEMHHHGLDPATRGAKLNEQIRALKQIWTNDVSEFHGEHVDFAPLFSWPKPVQTPHPPIYIGGDSRAALQRLRTLGDGWLPAASVPISKIVEVRQWLADNGRDDVPVMVWGAERKKDLLTRYAEAGVDEVALSLPTLNRSAMLRELDELATLAASLESTG